MATFVCVRVLQCSCRSWGSAFSGGGSLPPPFCCALGLLEPKGWRPPPLLPLAAHPPGGAAAPGRPEGGAWPLACSMRQWGCRLCCSAQWPPHSTPLSDPRRTRPALALTQPPLATHFPSHTKPCACKTNRLAAHAQLGGAAAANNLFSLSGKAGAHFLPPPLPPPPPAASAAALAAAFSAILRCRAAASSSFLL